MTPTFEYVSVFSNASAGALSVTAVSGLSTRHDATTSDRGRLYGVMNLSAGVYGLTLYSDRVRTAAVLAGTTSGLGTEFALAGANGSGLSGYARIDSYVADDNTVVAIPTFAVDADVLVNSSACARLPGFDPRFGMAYFHAQAVRQMLSADLPAYLPNLYASKSGISGYVPGFGVVPMPDLTGLANVDHLRMAQSALVKYRSAVEAEHTAEYADMAKLEMERYIKLLEAMRTLSILETEAADEEAATESVSFGMFRAGDL